MTIPYVYLLNARIIISCSIKVTFNDEIDDYNYLYEVFRVDLEGHPELVEGSWLKNIPDKGEKVGEIRVEDVVFDLTKRRFIHVSVFDEFSI